MSRILMIVGNWFPFGQRPIAYKNAFIKLTQTIRKYTSNTKMVWAPNNAMGYPWLEGNGKNKITASLTDEFNELDTNKDGVVSALDDPFTPFYPGDEWVDWIGISVFNFGDPNAPSTNILPPQNFFIKTIEPSDSNWNIYEMFCKAKNKPFAIMETASTYFPENVRLNDPTNLQIKQNWWNQVFGTETLRRYPLLKLIIWFDIRKKEEDPTGKMVTRDFKISEDSEIRKLIIKELPFNVYFADSKI
ncbi:hypothetical protein HMI56_000465 [Coelomomyces lativittatus]|nr:hypothetical protein HMI56_000465 [Coelomomyces lativittatus]